MPPTNGQVSQSEILFDTAPSINYQQQKTAPKGAVFQCYQLLLSTRVLQHAGSKQLLGFCDSLCRVQTLRAGVGAIHNGMAAIQFERIF